jgi:hypothetical protein
MAKGPARRITLAMLNKDLDGVASIVSNHLDDAVERLGSDRARELCAGFFDRMVTPSGTKVACTRYDLVHWERKPGGAATNADEVEVESVLSRLKEERVIREIASRDGAGTPQYEIFHDVLCLAALDWRARYMQVKEDLRLREQARQQSRTAKIQRWFGVALGAMAIAVIGLWAWGLQMQQQVRSKADEVETIDRKVKQEVAKNIELETKNRATELELSFSRRRGVHRVIVLTARAQGKGRSGKNRPAAGGGNALESLLGADRARASADCERPGARGAARRPRLPRERETRSRGGRGNA